MVKKEQQKKQENKKKKSNKISKKVLLFLIIISIIIIVFINQNNRIIKSDEMTLIISNEDISNKLNDDIIEKGGVIYLSYDDVKEFFDKSIYMEESTIIMSSDKKVAALELNSNNLEINGSESKIKGNAYKSDDGKIFLPISNLQNVYDMQVSYFSENRNIAIDYYSKKLEKACVTKNVLMSKEKSIFSEKVYEVKKGDWVIYISEEDGWAKVRSQKGDLGYIKKKYLTNFITEREDFQEKENFTEDYLEVDISKENIKNYTNRKELSEKLLLETINKKKKSVKIVYTEEDENLQRFKRESTAFLKECGISTKFDKK